MQVPSDDDVLLRSLLEASSWNLRHLLCQCRPLCLQRCLWKRWQQMPPLLFLVMFLLAGDPWCGIMKISYRGRRACVRYAIKSLGNSSLKPCPAAVTNQLGICEFESQQRWSGLQGHLFVAAAEVLWSVNQETLCLNGSERIGIAILLLLGESVMDAAFRLCRNSKFVAVCFALVFEWVWHLPPHMFLYMFHPVYVSRRFTAMWINGLLIKSKHSSVTILKTLTPKP